MITKALTNLPGIWALVLVSYADWIPIIAGTLAVVLSVIRIGQALGWWGKPRR